MIEPVIRAAQIANAARSGDYQKDGMLYCGVCHTPKQCRKTLFGREIVLACMCACAKEKYEQDEADRKKRENADRIMRLRSAGIASQTFRGANFTADDGKNPTPMATLRRYAERWEDMKRENIGLLLYGGVGTGKSYGAACIANYLIEQYTPACMINLSTVLNSMGGFQSEEKNTYISDLMRYPLLILDDFGMERQTEYALEQVFNVIDARYRSGKPLIITTNLSMAELNAPKTLEHKRIYDRIMEMCQPVNFGNNGRRADRAKEKMARAAELLRGN
ncbi:MAG: ATP-binding protein [Oscillospiraceae bacterium]|nr:ATP-binding protein [Oscillospiraceae bacterium]